uniref:Uncharacterized protein n=1 Tax=Oryza sativa subsp. japonica TaxID=39947 RepID=Q6K5S7_ORYSJ|nr:hypothetical protein [Oryza sativa Japonica Group]BAD22048.1 hypothetical protein [Oryza sativa Japonica Group]
MNMLLEKLLLSPVHNDTYKFIRFQDEKISAYILSNKIKHESSSSQMESPQDIQSISTAVNIAGCGGLIMFSK